MRGQKHRIHGKYPLDQEAIDPANIKAGRNRIKSNNAMLIYKMGSLLEVTDPGSAAGRNHPAIQNLKRTKIAG